MYSQREIQDIVAKLSVNGKNWMKSKKSLQHNLFYNRICSLNSYLELKDFSTLSEVIKFENRYSS